MKKRCSIVVGSSYGDEGKGRTVDLLASQSDPARTIGVRCNSGAQAGHTVVEETSGERHVFSHFSAATFRGVATLLGGDFIANPIVFSREYEELRKMLHEPKVFIEHGVQVTTPLDILLNQGTEAHRKGKRHGSCGLGFGETIQRRIKDSNLVLKFGDGYPSEEKRHELELYFLDCLKERQIAIWDLPEELSKTALAVKLGQFNWEPFQKHWEYMAERVEVKPSHHRYGLLFDYDHIIVENAQGLELDENNYEAWPHVTWASTGSRDGVFIGLGAEISVYYCTRTYLTRHGPGPFNEAGRTTMMAAGYVIDDPTNRPNPHQGYLRVGYLNVPELVQRISADFVRSQTYARNYDIQAHVVMCCCDQAPLGLAHKIAEELARHSFGFHSVHLGWSPRSADTELFYRRAEMGSIADADVLTREPPKVQDSTESTATETPVEEEVEA